MSRVAQPLLESGNRATIQPFTEPRTLVDASDDLWTAIRRVLPDADELANVRRR